VRRLSRHGHPHHRIRWELALLALLTVVALLLLADKAHGNFVYWANSTSPGSIGRAKINGTGANNSFIPGLDQASAVAVDSRFIYWSEPNRIGRANLDGTGVNPDFVTTGVTNALGIAVTANSGIYWVNHVLSGDTVGHAGIDGSGPVGSFFDTGSEDVCGLAADQSFVYWLNTSGDLRIGRASLSGANPDPNFIPVASAGCGVAVDTTLLYWDAGNSIGRAPVGGGSANAAFIPAPAAGTDSCGVAVNSQYVFWGNLAGSPGANFIGRANINGNAPNPGLIAGAGQPCALAAAPSNKITFTGTKNNKKKGTARISAKVPGPGQVTLTPTRPAASPSAASKVKQVGLTLATKGSFGLPVKPKGKTAKTLKKKGKAKVTVFVTFDPAGVAGVANSKKRTIKLVKKLKKK
jgi:hypothetical protein